MIVDSVAYLGNADITGMTRLARRPAERRALPDGGEAPQPGQARARRRRHGRRGSAAVHRRLPVAGLRAAAGGHG
ncbi:hypothetical protein ACFSTC_53970 [Nonomuraea ferruginea]